MLSLPALHYDVPKQEIVLTLEKAALSANTVF